MTCYNRYGSLAGLTLLVLAIFSHARADGPLEVHAARLIDEALTASRSAADLALRQMSAKGARLITVDELLTRKLVRRYRYRFAVAPGDSGVHGEGCIYLGVDRNGKRLGNGRRNNGRVRPRNRHRR